ATLIRGSLNIIGTAQPANEEKSARRAKPSHLRAGATSEQCAATAWLACVLALKQPQIAHVPLRRNQPSGDRALDCAAVLVRVGPIGISAERHKRAKLRKESFDFFRNDVPQLELADAGRIDHPTAEVEAQEL